MKNAYVTKREAPDGYVAITKPFAEKLYAEGKAVTLCGNNVNYFHVFDGWYLGYTVCNKTLTEKRETVTSYLDESFEDIHNDFLSYLEPNLGRYTVFYVKKEDVTT